MLPLSMRRPAARVLALAALAGMAGAAQAQTIDVTGAERIGAETRTARVHYGDLDLAAADGRDRLDRRVRRAVTQVCGSTPKKALDRRNDHARCTVMAREDAAAQLRSAVPMLAGGPD